MAKEATDTKVKLTEEQKNEVMQTIKLLNSRVKAKKVRIPSRVENISLKWLRDAPFFSEFLLRFHYYITEAVPTMGVNSRRGKINLYINEKFMNGGMEYIKFDEKTGEAVFKKDKKGEPKLDKDGNIEYEIEEWPGLSDSELEGVLVHEIMHLIRLHHERTLEDHYVFNIAGDMLINEDIKDMKIGRTTVTLPKGAVYLKMAKDDGYKGEPITEPLYDWLLELRKQYENRMTDLMQNADGQGQCSKCGGSGKEQGECESCGGDGKEKDGDGEETGNDCQDCNGSGKKEGKCDKCGGSGNGNQQGQFEVKYGSKIDEHEIMGDSDGLTESTIKEIIETGKIRGWGNISGNMISKLEELTKPAQIKWQQILRKYLSALIYNHGPWHENTWSRRNRRQLPLPGVKKLSNKIIVAVDTSGSIREKDLEAFFTEIESIVRDQSQLMVIQCDTEINDVRTEYKRGDYKKIDIKGRGGTIVQPVFDYMVEHKLTHFPLVYFTDGYFDYGFDTFRIKTIWCVTEECNEIPGGKNLYIDADND